MTWILSSALVGACALGLALTPGTVAAQVLPGGTLWVTRSEQAADCPDEAALRSATLALGAAAAEPLASAEPLSVEVDFQRSRTGYSAFIRSRGRKPGTRQLEKGEPSCASLAEAVSVVLAVLFDLAPEPAPAELVAETPLPAPGAAAPPPRAPAPPAPPNPPAAPSPAVAVRPAEPERGAPRLFLSAGVEAAAGYGLLGDAIVGAVAGSVRGRIDRWELLLGGLWAPNRTVSYLDRSVHLSLLSAHLGACGWLKREPGRTEPASADAGLCAGLYAGSLRGRGDGFDADDTAAEGWFAFEAGLAGRLPLADKWALRLGISAVIPFRRQTFSVSGAGVAFESSDAALLLSLGPELGFL